MTALSTFALFSGLSLAAYAVWAADPKPIPGQAGNDDLDLSASVIIDEAEIQQAVGAELGSGYVAVRMRATPKTDKPLRIGPDDFTIVSRKDGQRSQALLPEEIAGHGSTLIVKSSDGKSGNGRSRRTISLGGVGVGNAPPPQTNVDTEIKQSDQKAEPKDSPLLIALKAKGLPDKETTEAVEGLLYFPMDGKLKPKDLAVLYKGPAGRLVIEFQNPKGR